ncbi:MAG: diol dehydratase reactivase ATPase-like domain-containing protein [Myxococcales bacterium]|jgi:exopolyphosphatase/guanosine-5'-triphosphate,3'-diphosphate pyrophosphatase
MPRFATLDIGTNTVLLLVAEADGPRFRPVVERAEITRLGKGVDKTGRLAEDRIEATVSTVARFAAEARSLGAEQIACVATSASRDAANGQEFLARLEREAGVSAEIIGGDLEAQLTFLSAERELGGDRPLAVLDIGGGSTELVIGAGGKVAFAHSFDIGSVRLTERFLRSDPPSPDEQAALQRFIDETLAKAPCPPAGFRFVGIAGTVTTVLAVSRGIDPYDPARVHLAAMPFAEVHAERERYFSLTVDELRRLPGMEPKRADVIAAGALILERAMVRLGAPEVIVSDRGIRWGLLYQRFGTALGDAR